MASAALALAWSRYLSDQAAATGDPELAMRSARLGETSRQHLMAAHELCAREAKARPRSSEEAHAEMMARLFGHDSEDEEEGEDADGARKEATDVPPG